VTKTVVQIYISVLQCLSMSILWRRPIRLKAAGVIVVEFQRHTLVFAVCRRCK